LMINIAHLLGSFCSKITLHRMAVQAQEVNDCGPMAIAFAWSLARGKKPENLTYQQPRVHVQKCLLNGQFTDFPVVNRLARRRAVVPATTLNFQVTPQGENLYICELL